MTTRSSTVRLSSAGGSARITLARPPLNVLNIAMLEELAAALHSATADPAVKVIVLTGEDRAFCAGVDVADHTADRVVSMIAAFHGVIDALLSADVPVIAGVNGVALGGGFELALAADVIIAMADARLGVPEIRLGVIPPVAAVLLPRLVGRQRALDLILTGRTCSASAAASLGLVTWVEAPDAFASRLDAYAAQLASLSRPVLRLAKRAVTGGLDLPLAGALQRADTIYLEELMRLRDAQEGLAAFLEKRAPEWSDA